MRLLRLMDVRQRLVQSLLLGLVILFAGCDFEEKMLTPKEREEACVESYLTRFDINIVQGPALDDFFSRSKIDRNFFSMVKVGSSEASAVLYLTPIIPDSKKISGITDGEFEKLSEAYAENAKDGADIDIALKETETFKIFQALQEEALSELGNSKDLINKKLCTLTYVVGEERTRENLESVVDVVEGCYMEAPPLAKFIVPDEKPFYDEEFRGRLNESQQSITFRPIPLWRSSWAENKFGACLLYAYSARVQQDEAEPADLSQQ